MDHLVRIHNSLLDVDVFACYFSHKIYSFLGGHVVVPKTEKQNLDVVAIAEQYYKV